MHLDVVPAGPLQTNAYLLTAPELREAVIIDAPAGIWAEIRPLLAAAGCRLKELWVTHGHWDHTQGGAELVRAAGARVRAHRDDQELLEHPDVMEDYAIPGERLAPLKVDEYVTHGQRWTALGEAVEARHVPGHCPGSVLYYIAGLRAAFVGDTLFQGGIGRTDFPGGSAAALERSIRDQIFTLPADTVVYPGHGSETTVEAERETNPFVRA